MSFLSPESFVSPPFLQDAAEISAAGRFGPLVDHFAEFRALVASLAAVLANGPDADVAMKVVADLDMWVCFLEDAREAAARAPETDLVLTATWGARLSDIVRDARHALHLDERAAWSLNGSIAGHETAIPLSRLPESAPKPVAGSIGNRPPRLRRRRR